MIGRFSMARSLLFSLFLILICSTLISCAVNPVTGEKEFMLVSEEEEITIGKNAAPSLNWDFGGEYKDAELKSYLEGVVKDIWQVSERSHLPMRFVIQNTSIPNAFALPGYVAITRGLLSELENEAQFTAVMGHEAGHVMARHTAKRISVGTLQQIGIALGGVALEGGKGTDEILTLASIGSNLLLLKYDRNQEIQADRLGIKYMAKLGYEPSEALNAHERLEAAVSRYLKREDAKRKGDTFLDELFSTHPRTGVRRHEIEAMIRELSPFIFKGDGRFKEHFQSMTARIREANQSYFIYDEAVSLYEKGKFQDAEERLQKSISVNSEQAPFYNLMGMIRIKQKDFYESERNFKKALSIDADYQPSYYGLGITYYLKGNYSSAADKFKRSLELYPSHPPSLFGIGRSYFQLKEWKKAILYLMDFAQTSPKHPEVHGMLGISHENVSDIGAAIHEYELQVRIAPNTKLGRYAGGRLAVLKSPIR
ncbi:MAG: M48 family metalloprotease [Deltaproteobacteria bacterium]|nr:M48 family metalloprotease [Deltaproteobacteria bacterium]